jgi:preprotein translocase subunit YajC
MGEFVQALVTQSDGGSGAFFTMILPMIVMIGAMWYFAGRSDKKRQNEHQAFLSGLKRGDELVLNSGIVGKVALVEERTITLEVADKVKIKVLKQAISGPAARFLGAGAGAKGSLDKPAEKMDEAKAEPKPAEKKA